MKKENVPAYELVSCQDIPDIHSKGSLWRHKKSGARVMVLENDDENKVFNIAFRTPPADSTGVAHILEHSVLCGSQKFPLKDPFVELVKGSLNTFLNAMTYPDKTMYPVASCNDADFKNLMHVYLDAVFFPNIYEREEIFRQEGWHYELEDVDGPLKLNGVVYNEMKGAFSSPEEVLDREIFNSLFPDTPYGVESGGDPSVIPELKYSEFLSFHSRYYHPANSYIYLYGNMDMEERMNWMDREYLSKYDEIPVNSAIPRQKPFDQAKEIIMEYPISENEPVEENSYLSYNVVVGDSLDVEQCTAFEILDYTLLSAPGAPLKQALLDAGMGKDILGSYDDGIYQPFFSIVAKNAKPENKEAFVNLIQDTLRKIAKEGIDKKAIAAGINFLEFRFREADFSSFPKGLMYGIDVFDSWLYDDEKPFIHVEAIETFEFLKENIENGYFEKLIQKYLLDNTHGAIVVVKPEKGRTARMDRELEEKLQNYKEGLSDEEVEKLVRDTKQLQQYQEEPSAAEDLEKIPVLRREDISREIAPIYNEVLDFDSTPVVYHEIETNGIGYVDLLFDLSGVSEEMLPYAGILQAVLGIIDTNNYEYGELFNEINVHTGGIGTSLELYPNVEKVKEKEFKATFEIKTKALYGKLPVAFCMMQEILTESQLTDEKRLKEILSMAKSRLQIRFQSSGHTTAALRAMSYASPLSKLKDLTSGIGYYEIVKQIEEHFEEEKDVLIKNLQTLTKLLFRPENMMVSYTAAREGMEDLEKLVSELKAKLFTEPVQGQPCVIHCEKKNEGFKTSSKVQYVARAGNFIDGGASYTGALQILKVILSYDYLWQNVRVKGGAYGCMSNFTRIGDGYFVSYRDPNLEKTNEIYEGVAEYLRQFSVGERDMTKYIIGTISNIDQPMTPALKGERSMNLYMNHVTAQMIEEERAQILDANEEDIRALAEVVEAVLGSNQICVIGSEEKIEEQKSLFKETKSLF